MRSELPSPRVFDELRDKMATVLKWRDSQGRQRVHKLVSEEALIGRKSDADIVFSELHVSRHHAKLIREGEDYWILDLQSTHGTYVNGVRVDRSRLTQGDRITLGLESTTLAYFTDVSEVSTLTDTWDPYLDVSLRHLEKVLPPAGVQQSDLEKISCLLDFQFHWGRMFSVEKTFQQILLSALQISGAEHGFILVREGEEFRYVVGTEASGALLSPDHFKTSRGVVERVVSEGQPIYLLEGLPHDLADRDSVQDLRLRAVACTPLKGLCARSDTEEILGILYLDSTRAMHPVSGLDQKILDRLAVEAGNVLEKLEMIKTYEERRNLEQDLHLAKQTQRSLLPRALPLSEAYHVRAFNRPTRYVGGDFYDFLESPPGHLKGALADVSGKGVAAALLSSLLQGALHTECRTAPTACEALCNINRFLCSKTTPERFATLFLFLLGPDGHGEYLRAGHNPAYVLRHGRGHIDRLEEGNLMLGLFESADYETWPLYLGEGDILVVYSDGLTDAEDPGGEPFGEARLLDVLRAAGRSGAGELEKALLGSLLDFTRGKQQTDDITFLLVERRN